MVGRLFDFLTGYHRMYTTPPPTTIGKIKFYLGSIFEETIYAIVGQDKFYRWTWLHDFFERWH